MNSDGQLKSYSPIPTPIPTNSTTIPEPTASREPTSTLAAKPTTPTQPKQKPKPEGLSTAVPDVLAQQIESYHKDAERRCLADYAKDTHDKNYYCPCLPTEFRTYNYHSFPFFFNRRILPSFIDWLVD